MRGNKYDEARAIAEFHDNRNEAEPDVLLLSRALLSALAEIEAKGGSDGWQAEVLSMIFEECKRLDESGYDGSGTPPMSYNDWIRRLVLRARAERDAALREREEARGLLAYVGGRVAADVASEDAVPTREEIDFALLRRSEREEASRAALAEALRGALPYCGEHLPDCTVFAEDLGEPRQCDCGRQTAERAARAALGGEAAP